MGKEGNDISLMESNFTDKLFRILSDNILLMEILITATGLGALVESLIKSVSFVVTGV